MAITELHFFVDGLTLFAEVSIHLFKVRNVQTLISVRRLVVHYCNVREGDEILLQLITLLSAIFVLEIGPLAPLVLQLEQGFLVLNNLIKGLLGSTSF